MRGLLIPSAAVAQAPSANSDPSALICRVTGETGSRLQRIRTCKTRAQWEEEIRREQRNALDRGQAKQDNRTVDEALRGN